MPTAFQEIAELYDLMDKYTQLADEYAESATAPSRDQGGAPTDHP